MGALALIHGAAAGKLSDRRGKPSRDLKFDRQMLTIGCSNDTSSKELELACDCTK